jgi:hypothetical protein
VNHDEVVDSPNELDAPLPLVGCAVSAQHGSPWLIEVSAEDSGRDRALKQSGSAPLSPFVVEEYRDERKIRAISSNPPAFLPKKGWSLVSQIQTTPAASLDQPKADEILLIGYFYDNRLRFLLDSATPNIAISRSANYYERCPR